MERETDRPQKREREREAAAAWGREKKKEALIPIGPQDMRV